MSCLNVFVFICRHCLIGGLLVGTVVMPAWANQFNIRADYRTDQSRPNEGRLVVSGEIGGCLPPSGSLCQEFNVFDVVLKTVASTKSNVLSGNKVGFSMSSDWKEFEVVNVKNNRRATLEIRLIALAAIYDLGVDVKYLVGGDSDPMGAHARVWREGGWNQSVGYDCDPLPQASATATSYSFVWRANQRGNSQSCMRTSNYDIGGSFTYRQLRPVYEVRAKNILKVPSGQYVGAVSFGVGSNGEIVPENRWDFEILHPEIMLNFTLDVDQALKVDLPPGGNSIELLPTGGWEAWWQRGGKVEELRHDQAFFISASGPFVMRVICDISGSDLYSCGMKNLAGKIAGDLRLRVTIPNVTYNGCSNNGCHLLPVQRFMLQTGGGKNGEFSPGVSMDQQRGVLDFRIVPAASVFKTPGTYFANVTVVWDSEI